VANRIVRVAIEMEGSAPQTPERLRLESLRVASRFSIEPLSLETRVAQNDVRTTPLGDEVARDERNQCRDVDETHALHAQPEARGGPSTRMRIHSRDPNALIP
jgi:hypothetical protein